MSSDTANAAERTQETRLLPASLEDRLVNWLGRIGGMSLLLAVGLIWLCLLTWTVTDPSLTLATGGKAHNGLGALGAIVSDLLLQMLGFATAIALLAPMLWALELMAADRVPGFRIKASFYPLSILLLAGALSTLPVTASWPLHHGLGGILGDLLASVGNTIFGVINPERAAAATGFVLCVSGFSALGYSIGLDLKDLSALLERKAKPVDEKDAADTADTAKGAAAAGLGAWLATAWRRRKSDSDSDDGRERGTGHETVADAPSDHELADAGPLLPGLPQSDAERAWFHRGQQMAPQGWGRGPEGRDAPGFGPEPRGSASYVDHEHAAPGDYSQPPYGRRGQPAGDYADATYGTSHGHPADWSERDWSGVPAADIHPESVPTPHAAWGAPIPIAMAVRGPRSPEPARDAVFDVHTEAMSRDMAERFAPASAAQQRSPSAPGPDAGAPRKAIGIFSGLAFRRAEPVYKRPSLNLLKRPTAAKSGPEFTQTVLRGNARLLEDVLSDFGVKGEVRDIKPGPVVTLYEFEPARGIKSSRIIGLADDIARSMSANAVRVAVVPGRNAIGIELPNARREGVLLREILEAEQYRGGESILPLALGKSISGDPVVVDLARMPHLLVAGTTGSGKSVGINAMVLSLLYKHTPDDCRLIMIDPKMLELSVYNGIPHLLTPVVTDPVKAVAALNWAVAEMEERYKRMSKLSVRNIDVFNNRVRNAKKRGEMMSRSVQTGFDKRGQAVYETEALDLEPMPYIVVVVDEFADLMIVAGKEIEAAVQRLAQMARAAGIHLVMATQRPSVDIVTGTIKANFPTRIGFKVASKIDSRTILNDQGAEQLLGQGDMLYSTGSGQPMRVHGAFVSDEEVETIARALREQGEPRYVEGITEPALGNAAAAAADARVGAEDDLYDRAVAVVMRDRKASTSYVQRRLSIGYNRAADLIERMEREGLISPPNGTGRREILGGPGSSADEV